MEAAEFFVFNKQTAKYVRKGDWRAMDIDAAVMCLLEVWPYDKIGVEEARAELIKLKSSELFKFTTAEIAALKTNEKQKQTSIDWDNIYAQVSSLINIRFYTGDRKDRLVYVENANREIMTINFKTPQDIVDAMFSDDKLWTALKDFYNNDETLKANKHKLAFSAFIDTLIKNHVLMDETRKLLTPPKHLSWEPEEYAFKKINRNLIVPGPTPYWDEFTSRLDYPELFMAWVWSVLEPTNTVRQVLWITGEGQDGKSAVQKALEFLVGDSHSYAAKRADFESQFFLGSVEGKALISIPDNRNQLLLKNDYIKQISGGDSASIERKGAQSRSGIIRAKIYVHSNYIPLVNPDSRFETSRLLHLNLKKPKSNDADFEEKLKSEVWQFLAKCKDAFDANITPGYDNIKIPADVFKSMLLSCSSRSYQYAKFFEEQYITYDDKKSASMSDLTSFLVRFRDENALSVDQYKFFKMDLDLMLELKNVSKIVEIEKNGQKLLGYKGFSLGEKK